MKFKNQKNYVTLDKDSSLFKRYCTLDGKHKQIYKKFTPETRKEIINCKSILKRKEFFKEIILYNINILKEYRDDLYYNYIKGKRECIKQFRHKGGRYRLSDLTLEEKKLYDERLIKKNEFDNHAKIDKIKITFLSNNIYFLYRRLNNLGIVKDRIFNKERDFIKRLYIKDINLYKSNLFGIYGKDKDEEDLKKFIENLFNNDTKYNSLNSLYNQYEVSDEDIELRKVAIDEILAYLDSQKSRFRLITDDNKLNKFKEMLDYFIGVLYLDYNENITKGLPVNIAFDRIFSEDYSINVLINGTYTPINLKLNTYNYNFYLEVFKSYLNSIGLLLITCYRCKISYNGDHSNSNNSNTKKINKDKNILLNKKVSKSSSNMRFNRIGHYETLTKEGINRIFSLFSINTDNLDIRYKKGISKEEKEKIDDIKKNINLKNNDDISNIKKEELKKDLTNKVNLKELDNNNILNSIALNEERKNKLNNLDSNIGKGTRASYNFLFDEYMKLYDSCKESIPESCIMPLSYGSLRPTSYFDISKKDNTENTENNDKNSNNINAKKNDSIVNKYFRQDFLDTYDLTDEVDRHGSIYSLANNLGGDKYDLMSNKNDDIYRSIAKDIFNIRLLDDNLIATPDGYTKFRDIPTREEVKRVCMSFGFGLKSQFKYMLKGFYLFSSVLDKEKYVRRVIQDKRFFNLLEVIAKKHYITQPELLSLIKKTFYVDKENEDENSEGYKVIKKYREVSFSALSKLIITFSVNNGKISKFYSVTDSSRVFFLQYLVSKFDVFETLIRVLHINYKDLCKYFYKLSTTSKDFINGFSYSCFGKDFEIKKMINKFRQTQEIFKKKLSFPNKAQYTIFLAESIHTLLCIRHLQMDAKNYLAQYNLKLNKNHPLVIPHYDSIVFNPNFFNKDYIQYISDYYFSILDRYIGQCKSYYYIHKYLLGNKEYKSRVKKRFSYKYNKFTDTAIDYYKNYLKRDTINSKVGKIHDKVFKNIQQREKEWNLIKSFGLDEYLKCIYNQYQKVS